MFQNQVAMYHSNLERARMSKRIFDRRGRFWPFGTIYICTYMYIFDETAVAFCFCYELRMLSCAARPRRTTKVRLRRGGQPFSCQLRVRFFYHRVVGAQTLQEPLPLSAPQSVQHTEKAWFWCLFLHTLNLECCILCSKILGTAGF